MMQIRIGSEAPKQRYPFFASALKPRGSASNRYLGSFMAGRRLIAAMRQTLIISFSCLARFSSAGFYTAGLNAKPSGTTPVLT